MDLEAIELLKETARCLDESTRALDVSEALLLDIYKQFKIAVPLLRARFEQQDSLIADLRRQIDDMAIRLEAWQDDGH